MVALGFSGLKVRCGGNTLSRENMVAERNLNMCLVIDDSLFIKARHKTEGYYFLNKQMCDQRKN